MHATQICHFKGYNDDGRCIISRCFIKICPISISQKMLYRYNENPRICDVVTSNIFHYINFLFQDFCRYNEKLLYSSVVISRLTCIKCYTVKVVSLREAVLSQSITQLGVIVNRIA